MYNEMESDGQMMLDCRLSSEKSLEDNTSAMIEFAYSLLKNDESTTKVKNAFEGYGILADQVRTVGIIMKQIQDGMKDFLASLGTDDSGMAVEKVGSIQNSVADLITSSVRMASESKRIQDDLYVSAWRSDEAELSVMDEDGFEEADQEEAEEEVGEVVMDVDYAEVDGEE